MRIKTRRIKLLLTAASLLFPLMARAQEENMETLFDVSHIIAYVVAMLLMGFFCLIFYNRLIVFRALDNRMRSRTQNMQLAMILSNSRLRVWLFNPDLRTYSLLSKDGNVQETYMPLDFSRFYERDDFERMRQDLTSIVHNHMKQTTIVVRGNASKYTSGPMDHTLEVTLRVFERNEEGRPTTIIGLERDITEEMKQQEHVDKLMMRYQTVFKSSDIDLIYYDKDGYLVDINEKACQTFGVKSRSALLSHKLTINDMDPFKDIDINTFAGYRLTSSFNIDQIRKSGQGKVPDITVSGKMIYDIVMNPIRNEQGVLIGLYTAGRDITEMVETFHRQKESTRRLSEATKSIENYVNNINYSLQTSQVRLMNYYPDRHVLEINSDLSHTQYKLTQVRCIGLVSEEHRRQARGLLRRMDRRENTQLNTAVRTIMKDKKGYRVWLTFNIFPMLGKDGTVSHYFGMCRNTTEWMTTQQQLQEETAKALETERLKDAFLLNMSYEIRTPLNTVLGFAQLFGQEHDPADEPLFADEIKRNANTLLTLVNESLYLSRLDAHMIEMRPSDTDFPIVFDSYCRIGMNTLKPGVRCIIENPYEHLLMSIDEQWIGQIVQRLCTNAAFHTNEGFVRAKYEYHQGMLTISIDDSGNGVAKEVRSHMFDRFATDNEGNHCSSGLDLPIVKELTEQLGGSVECQSERGKGTTIWVNIPCEATSIEKKKEILPII
ncbi:MAG: PAS domain-containing sensor histidine kinase [Prevotella sp.]|nr:PAS domain-containing sensor histidine kinase [Prevotella sp.]